MSRRTLALVVALAAVGWPLTAAATLDCRVGYQELASNGTTFGCIQTNQRAAAGLFEADAACFAEGGRIPLWSEHRMALANLSLEYEANSEEWIGDADSSGEFRNSAVAYDRPDSPFPPVVTQSYEWTIALRYRCFIPQPTQLQVAYGLPTGPAWLTVALLATGVFLQWRSVRENGRT